MLKAGIEPHLAEPAETSALRGPKRRAKTDKADARLQRELLAAGRLPECYIPRRRCWSGGRCWSSITTCGPVTGARPTPPTRIRWPWSSGVPWHRAGRDVACPQRERGRNVTEPQQGSPPIWICPECGARLITRNLWHSCGQFTLEALFANSDEDVLELARKYVALLHRLGDVQVISQKTRLVCVARVRFSGLEPRKHGFLASFALHRWLDSPRIVKTADYGPRWRAHYVRVGSGADLNDELITWLQEAHDTVGLQSDLRRASVPRLKFVVQMRSC